MLERHLADNLVSGVHRATEAILTRLHVRSIQQEPCRCRGAEVEVERTIRADGDASGNWDASVDMRGAGVELL